MSYQNQNRVVYNEIIVDAPITDVWKAWTTENGAETFFAPKCHINLRPNGAYEILFFPENEPGLRGAEGMRVMAFQAYKMLAFTWNAPPHLPTVRHQLTHVIVRFCELDIGRTKVTLTHGGWGEGGEWDAALAYFSSAWSEVILPRLKYRFAHGPIDWQNVPDMRQVEAAV